LVICQAIVIGVTPEELSERLWQFAARIAKVVDALPDTWVGRHVAGQIVRSGIAAAPNYDEARSGESRADFIHKVNIALKELVETRGWLKFIILAKLLPAKRVAVLVEECNQLCRILGKSVATAKAARKSGPVEEPDQRLAMTNSRFSTTNSQSSSPRTQSITSPSELPKK
jgi:four helix bundle protein